MASVMDEARSSLEAVLNLLHTQNQHLERIAAQTVKVSHQAKVVRKRSRHSFTGIIPTEATDEIGAKFVIPMGTDWYIKSAFASQSVVGAVAFNIYRGDPLDTNSSRIDPSKIVFSLVSGVRRAALPLADIYLPGGESYFILVNGKLEAVWALNLDIDEVRDVP